MPYDVKRLNAIYQGEAEISDRDAVIEIAAGMVETMVRGHPKPSPAMEDRYRTQLRSLREVLRRQGIDLELPDSLRRWLAEQPGNIPTFHVRDKAGEVFGPLLDGLDEREDGARAYDAARGISDRSGGDPRTDPPMSDPPPAVTDPASIFISYSHED